MVAAAQASDTHVDVVNAGIVMNEHDVVVEQENVEDEHAELYEERHEKSDEATGLGLLVVVV